MASHCKIYSAEHVKAIRAAKQLYTLYDENYKRGRDVRITQERPTTPKFSVVDGDVKTL